MIHDIYKKSDIFYVITGHLFSHVLPIKKVEAYKSLSTAVANVSYHQKIWTHKLTAHTEGDFIQTLQHLQRPPQHITYGEHDAPDAPCVALQHGNSLG